MLSKYLFSIYSMLVKHLMCPSKFYYHFTCFCINCHKHSSSISGNESTFSPDCYWSIYQWYTWSQKDPNEWFLISCLREKFLFELLLWKAGFWLEASLDCEEWWNIMLLEGMFWFSRIFTFKLGVVALQWGREKINLK